MTQDPSKLPVNPVDGTTGHAEAELREQARQAGSDTPVMGIGPDDDEQMLEVVVCAAANNAALLYNAVLRHSAAASDSDDVREQYSRIIDDYIASYHQLGESIDRIWPGPPIVEWKTQGDAEYIGDTWGTRTIAAYAGGCWQVFESKSIYAEIACEDMSDDQESAKQAALDYCREHGLHMYAHADAEKLAGELGVDEIMEEGGQ